MRIFIVGLGTIGEPLAKLFLELKSELGIEEVIVHKNTPELEYRGMLERFHRCGASLATYAERQEDFVKLLKPYDFAPKYTFEEALERATVVVDCTKEKIGRMLQEQYYLNAAEPLGFIAQGSEKGFGVPYAFRINDSSITPEINRFVQVVSCNTHQILSVLHTLVLAYEGPDNLVKARFYIARRASDISQSSSTVGVEVGEATESPYGSHQGEDAMRVLRTIGIENLDIHAAADKLNNPFMHVIDFTLELVEPLSLHEVEQRFRHNPLCAVTYWKSNNEVFAAGRDWGHFGRILNQTVVCIPSLEVLRHGHEVRGRCFTPQDGNALLSSAAATLRFADPVSYQDQMKRHFFRLPFLFDEV